MRESLFNVLQGGKFGDPVDGARVLDLFAGTGALGLEALSRGAEQVCFVDDGRKSGQLIRENIRITRTKDRTRVVVGRKCAPASPLPTLAKAMPRNSPAMIRIAAPYMRISAFMSVSGSAIALGAGDLPPSISRLPII